jgi:hypothetical protein
VDRAARDQGLHGRGLRGRRSRGRHGRFGRAHGGFLRATRRVEAAGCGAADATRVTVSVSWSARGQTQTVTGVATLPVRIGDLPGVDSLAMTAPFRLHRGMHHHLRRRERELLGSDDVDAGDYHLAARLRPRRKLPADHRLRRVWR